MNESEILLAVIERAKLGERITPDAALSMLASVINRLDRLSDDYERNVAALFDVGACIWTMRVG